MRHLIISCTKEKAVNTPLYKSIIEYKKNNDLHWCHMPQLQDIILENNTKGLSEIYNHYYDIYKSKYDSMIFVHDDVEIDNFSVYTLLDLEKAYEQFDIIGLAGGLNPVIEPLTLWHHMCAKTYSCDHNLYGKVGHFDNKGNKFITDFGPTPHRVCILDGLFLAVNLKKVRETDWKLDPQFDFHCYDIDASLYANSLGLKLGVWPILVYHHSPGLRDINDPIFQKNQKKFLEKYS